MMQVYRLDGKDVDIVSCPSDDVRKGDYILIEDSTSDSGLIVQVVNIGYANVPGVLADILRESSSETIEGRDFDSLKIQSFVDMIKDAKVFKCKVRRALFGGILSYDVSWIPPRTSSGLMKISDKDLLKIVGSEGERSIVIGSLKGGAEVSLPLSSIDGGLNIITGRKGAGKSHLSKILVLDLVSNGGICMVLDVNGEYINLGYSSDGEKTALGEKIHVLSPGGNFKVTLKYTGLNVFLSIASSVLDLPANSAWEIRRIWKHLEEDNALSIKRFGEAVASVSNPYVRDALLRRYEILVGSGLFTDNVYEAATLEEWMWRMKYGGAIIINLRGLPSALCRIVVEFILSKLTHLLERRFMRAAFLFAEEAHLYLRQTYWEDIVTRMRHLGIFSTFITNQPDSVSTSIYRQADNIFLLNFTNENDLAIVSKAAMVDVETVNAIAKELPPHHCLILGKVVNDFPIVVKIRELRVKAMGETRFFFKESKGNGGRTDIFIEV
jgi:DNA helicase HerA-like ATPase